MFLEIAAPLHRAAEPELQWIETASSLQIPGFHIVGLASREVDESRERIRAAIEASGLDFPRRRVLLNLSPASVRKRGTGLDLAMALSVLGHTAREQDLSVPDGTQAPRAVAWGELGLTGRIRPVGQVVRAVHAAWKERAALVILPPEELPRARLALDLIRGAGRFAHAPPALRTAATLREAWALMREGETGGEGPDGKGTDEEAPETPQATPEEDPGLLPLSPSLERVAALSAAGAHHLLLLGPRGSGKSHACDWVAALQPRPGAKALLDRFLVSELSTPYPGLDPAGEKASVRRVGVHVRPQALVGGTFEASLRPGEFTAAHEGLLLADELPEWASDSREALREPLERGTVTISRTDAAIELPAGFTLVANGNLCPCGGWVPALPTPPGLHPADRCRCAEPARRGYLGRLTGPVLDRIDIVTLVTRPPDLPCGPAPRDTRNRLRRLRENVARARGRALLRWGALPARLAPAAVEELLRAHPEWAKAAPLRDARTLRSRHKIARLALTLAALDGEDGPSVPHFHEASRLRPESLGVFS